MFNQNASPFLRSRASTANLIQEDLPEKPKRTLNTIQLLCVTFFCVSGGGYGLEQAVHHGYPLFTLLALIMVPWFWSLPSALMTAELSSAIPENGGFILWIKKGLGPFWAFQAGWWSWIYTLVDNALYPVMFVDYLSHFTGQIHSTEVKLVIRIGVILFIAVINLWGIEIVGLLAIVFTVLVLSPFMFLVFWGLGDVNSSCLTETHHPPTDFNWGIFLSVILWNTAGWDNASTVAGEINNPQTTYPRALLGAVVLVMTSYILPLSAAVCINNDFEKWEVGYYPQILGQEFGKGMEYMSSFSALVASIGLFNVIMCTSSRVLASFSADDMAGFKRLGELHSDFKTPYVAIVINAVGIAIFSFLPFESLIQLDISMYGLSLILKFMSLVFLRFREPLLQRPYKIPLGRNAIVAFVLPPICLAFTSFLVTSSTTKVISVIVILVGLVLYVLCYWKNNRNLAFETQKHYFELQDQFSTNVSDDSDTDTESQTSPRVKPKQQKPD